MTGEPRRDGPGRPRDPAVDEAILRAAVDLLIERGVERAGIEAIAKRAGVSKVTVYRRWRSKEELLARALESVRSEIPEITAAASSAEDLPEALGELLPAWGEVLAEPRFQALAARLLGAGMSHPELLEVYWRHHVRPRMERSRAFMREAQRAGVLAPTADVDVLIDMMNGAITQFLLARSTPATPAEITRYLARVLRQAGFTVPDVNDEDGPHR